ncbi:MAG TPA: polyhydroxyalkanoate depolymerase [Stellaceae bacterium]|nr:polyhydroxyalkanoate depolymerase [Stellaceae bacterium]
MLYQAYQVQTDAFAPFRMLARAGQEWLNQPWLAFRDHPALRHAAAACELVSRVGMSHRRPDFGIVETEVAGKRVAVREEAVLETPFCTLLRFRKDSTVEQPRLLLVAPLSGHFATLLRGTVETLLQDHDVYITDWVNARNVALRHGRFDLDDHIDLMIAFMRALGPELNVVAVCQPAVSVLAATALLAQAGDAAQPRTITLMGGPIDTRAAPTQVSRFAETHSLAWLERNVVSTVPARYAGAFRRVYPGFLQLAGFLSMNLDRHVNAHVDLYRHLVSGDGESAAATKKFYDEYASVMDLPADFYLQTIDRVFHRQALARGTFVSRSTLVEPGAIARTAVFAIEGENDDICAVGQTAAVNGLLTGLDSAKKRHHVQPGVGHYGVFNGRGWRTGIYPKLRAFIRENA